MTAIVIPFKAKTATTECQCPKHRLYALADRIRARLDQTDALVIPREDLTAALEDLAATTDRLCPPDARTHPMTIKVPDRKPRRRDRKTCASCEASAAGCRRNEWLSGRRCRQACAGDHDKASA